MHSPNLDQSFRTLLNDSDFISSLPANSKGLQQLLGFVCAEYCTRNKAIEPQAIVQLCK